MLKQTENDKNKELNEITKPIQDMIAIQQMELLKKSQTEAILEIKTQ